MQMFALKFSVLEKSLLVLRYLASLTFCRFLIQTKGKKAAFLFWLVMSSHKLLTNEPIGSNTKSYGVTRNSLIEPHSPNS